jgi:hypothetical protein
MTLWVALSIFPLESLLMVGHSNKNAKALMHGVEGIGVDGLKDVNPGLSTHDGIHVGDIMAATTW